jgi:hypothetical protein
MRFVPDGTSGMVRIHELPDFFIEDLPPAKVACFDFDVQPNTSIRTCFHQGLKVPSLRLELQGVEATIMDVRSNLHRIDILDCDCFTFTNK